ncbi:hypothetical protein Patl1_14819 [Pistacia atlantica]|uniref:Uncharacterized protein n=1 Tax=Pistacia atlantica TaxID=434234 RepID=A0ACC1ASN8_9ROSI|nr:hypothetical protein Patl1_14819 [Pistacia atlantica]
MYHIFLLFTCYSGEKKKHQKEMIAVKHSERMLRQGVDLEQINLPISFVSSGVMRSETVEIKTLDSIETTETFERLGKDGQCMSKPIEVVQRSKSRGLGVEFLNIDDDSARKVSRGDSERQESHGDSRRRESHGNSTRKGPQSIGAFEKHTKGFGSKMTLGLISLLCSSVN